MCKAFLEYMPFLFSLLLAIKGRFYWYIHAYLLNFKKIEPCELRNVVFSETVLSMVTSPYVAIVYCTSILGASGKTGFLPWCILIFIVHTLAAGAIFVFLTPQKMVLLRWPRWLPMLLEIMSIFSCACVFYFAHR